MPESPDVDQSNRAVRWSSGTWQNGFTAIPNVVFAYDLGPIAFRVYALLVRFSWLPADEWPGQEALADIVQCSERSFRDAIRELEGAGLVQSKRRGLGKTNLYLLIEPRDDIAADPADQNPEPAADPSLSKEQQQEVDLPPVVPHPANRPGKVDRRPVTDAEYSFAAEVLYAFNQLANTRYNSRDYIAKIIMRAREHPDLPPSTHARVIAHALAHPWWKGPPSPSVVYGNASLFERAIHAEAEGGSVGLTAAEVATMGEEWGPGTPHETPAAARAAAVLADPTYDLDLPASAVREDDDDA